MLSVKETEIAMERFFNDSLNFWKRIGLDDRQAFEAALDDAKKSNNKSFFT